MSAESPPNPRLRLQILVCDGPSCGVTYESEVLKDQLLAEIAADPSMAGRVHVIDYMCFGRCSEGPNMFVRRLVADEPGDAEPASTVLGTERGFYPGVDSVRCARILREHCVTGTPVAEWVDDY